MVALIHWTISRTLGFLVRSPFLSLKRTHRFSSYATSRHSTTLPDFRYFSPLKHSRNCVNCMITGSLPFPPSQIHVISQYILVVLNELSRLYKYAPTRYAFYLDKVVGAWNGQTISPLPPSKYSETKGGPLISAQKRPINFRTPCIRPYNIQKNDPSP